MNISYWLGLGLVFTLGCTEKEKPVVKLIDGRQSGAMSISGDDDMAGDQDRQVDEQENDNQDLDKWSLKSPHVVAKFDRDQDGLLNRAERKLAREFIRQKRSEAVNAKIRKAIQKEFDENGDGNLNAEEQMAMDETVEKAALAYANGLMKVFEFAAGSK